MSCDCSGCQRGRQIGALRQMQKERCVRARTKKYPKLSKKIWDDRIKAQELVVQQYRKWCDEAVERSSGRTKYGWGDPMMFKQWLESATVRLERIKADAAKTLGDKA